jgi:hypothetical protein
VTFDLCDSFDPDGDPLRYSVHFDDYLNEPSASYSGTACSTQYTYDDAGTFRPEVCVDDDQNPPECVTVVLSIVESFLAADAPRAEPDDGLRRAEPDPEPEAPQAAPGSEIALDSQLTVPGATGQIVVNGSQSHFVGSAPVRVSARGQSGANRVEAVLVAGKGQPGRWRLDLAGSRTPVVGLRIVAGQTVSVSPSEVIFSLSGRPGERIVFTFELPPDAR